ncbi:hypothetical protein GY45DRAFT_681733 [Cubamyces sp. BRFM 1775]|nr:hypothetical protein GY45DRAFT_681733 [Cubamyces sp. BRFM 1775]
MSSRVPKHNFYLVFAPDVPNSREARERHLPAHMERVQQLSQSGLLRLGGGVLPPDVKATDPDAADKLRGGFIIVKAESIEAVWKIVKEDILYTSGEVWDRERITVESLYIAMPEAKFD